MKHYGLELPEGTSITNGELRIEDDAGRQYFALAAPSVITTSYTLTFPAVDAAGALTSDGAGNLSFVPIGASRQAAESSFPYDITAHAFSKLSKLRNGDLMGLYIAVRAFRVEASGHKGYAVTAPDAAATITVNKNGSSIGTIVFNEDSNTVSSETIAETDFAIGDRLDFIFTKVRDAKDVSVTLNARTI